MQDARFRKPALDQFPHARPVQAVPLTATDQCSPPQQSQPKPEHIQAIEIARYRVIVEVTLHDRLQPLPSLLNGIMRTVEELQLDFLKLGSHPFTDRLALDHEVAIPFLPADMREAEKVKRFGLTFSSSVSVAFGKLPELNPARLVWV